MTEQDQKHLGKTLWDIADQLRTALTADFGKGFSYANLFNCRQFYLTFPDQAILSTLCRELSWSHLRSDSSATDKESLSVQAESEPAATDHFPGVGKMVWHGHNRRAAA